MSWVAVTAVVVLLNTRSSSVMSVKTLRVDHRENNIHVTVTHYKNPCTDTDVKNTNIHALPSHVLEVE